MDDGVWYSGRWYLLCLGEMPLRIGDRSSLQSGNSYLAPSGLPPPLVTLPGTVNTPSVKCPTPHLNNRICSFWLSSFLARLSSLFFGFLTS